MKLYKCIKNSLTAYFDNLIALNLKVLNVYFGRPRDYSSPIVGLDKKVFS